MYKFQARTKSLFHRRAFTLIELIAAIALFAVVMLGISALLGETTQITQRLKFRQGSVLSGQLALDRLGRELSMAFNENEVRTDTLFLLKNEAGGPELIFSYLDSPVRSLFVRRTPGIKVVRYYLDRDEKSGLFNLKRAELPLLESREISNPDEMEGMIVAKGIVELKYELYDFRNDQWIDTWDDKSQFQRGSFPQAARIQLEVVNPEVPKTEYKSRSLKYTANFLILNEERIRK